MSTTIRWSGTATATSSISHGGQTRGTVTLLRREQIVQPDGTALWVPLISGNAVRGRLRRIGEELLRDELGYEGRLSLPAATMLRSGGALTKTTREPLSGGRLRQLRHLVPHVGVFGGAAGSRTIDSALRVGKWMPLVAEAAHVLGRPDAGTVTAFSCTQLEQYARLAADGEHAFDDVMTTLHTGVTPVKTNGEVDVDALSPTAGRSEDPDGPMLFRVETWPAGTRFDTWFALERATDLEAAFFDDVLHTFATTGWVGGRSAIGHGQFRLDLDRTDTPTPPASVDWRAHVREYRDDALEALTWLA